MSLWRILEDKDCWQRALNALKLIPLDTHHNVNPSQWLPKGVGLGGSQSCQNPQLSFQIRLEHQQPRLYIQLPHPWQLPQPNRQLSRMLQPFARSKAHHWVYLHQPFQLASKCDSNGSVKALRGTQGGWCHQSGQRFANKVNIWISLAVCHFGITQIPHGSLVLGSRVMWCSICTNENINPVHRSRPQLPSS